jgi:hypothetical protein
MSTTKGPFPDLFEFDEERFCHQELSIMFEVEGV